MGEAIYYFKAKFPSEEKAKKALPEIKKYLAQHQHAYNEWQEIRNKATAGYKKYRRKIGGCKKCQKKLKCLTEGKRKLSAVCRFNYLQETYPLAFSTLEKIKIKEDDTALNDLAGNLLCAEDLEQLERIKEEIRFHQEVWHFDKWEHLCRFAKNLGGQAKYLSDEYVEREDYFKLIEV